jgi:hypothetical protein
VPIGCQSHGDVIPLSQLDGLRAVARLGADKAYDAEDFVNVTPHVISIRRPPIASKYSWASGRVG